MSNDSNKTIQGLSEDPPPPYHTVVGVSYTPQQSASHQHLVENRDVQCSCQLPPGTQSQATIETLTFPRHISFSPTGQAMYIISVPAPPPNSNQPLLPNQYEPLQVQLMREGPKETRGSQMNITDEPEITDDSDNYWSTMIIFGLLVLFVLFLIFIVAALVPIHSLLS